MNMKEYILINTWPSSCGVREARVWCPVMNVGPVQLACCDTMNTVCKMVPQMRLTAHNMCGIMAAGRTLITRAKKRRDGKKVDFMTPNMCFMTGKNDS